MTSVLALDLGGTKVEAAIVSAEGVVVDGSRARRATGRDIDPATLTLHIHAVLSEAVSAVNRDDIVGVGIGAAGPFLDGGSRIAPVNMPGLHGFRIIEAVAASAESILGRSVPTRLGHDGGCLALAEAWRGATVGSRASLSMVVSTGIGGGIVMDGMLLAGASGNAGHLGQAFVRGETLTLEEIASGPASVAWARNQGWPGSTGEELARAAADGDGTARAAIERSARAVGAALASAVTLLDLDLVAIGGGFSQSSEDYVTLVQKSLRENAVLDYARSARVVRSGLHGEGPLIGAAAVALRAAGVLG